MNNLVGSNFDSLPHWLAQWGRVDSALVEVADINGDRTLQFGELKLGADMIMLATPELGGMPFVISGLVAAGGLAAALSTADGLLLTISNALVHDMNPRPSKALNSPEGHVLLSKFALLAVAMLAALVAAWKPAQILALVTASFSLAAAAFFPGMVLGLFWKGAHRVGVVCGMLSGLGVTVFYMFINAPFIRASWGLDPWSGFWFGVQPVSAGVFGVPLGFVVTMAVSWFLPQAPISADNPEPLDSYPGL